MGDDDLFVVGVKRERRDEVPSNWRELVRGTPGVTIVGDASAVRMQIKASPEAVRQLQHQLSDYVHIEPVLRHRLL